VVSTGSSDGPPVPPVEEGRWWTRSRDGRRAPSSTSGPAGRGSRRRWTNVRPTAPRHVWRQRPRRRGLDKLDRRTPSPAGRGDAPRVAPPVEEAPVGRRHETSGPAGRGSRGVGRTFDQPHHATCGGNGPGAVVSTSSTDGPLPPPVEETPLGLPRRSRRRPSGCPAGRGGAPGAPSRDQRPRDLVDRASRSGRSQGPGGCTTRGRRCRSRPPAHRAPAGSGARRR
jgi:hypothetical protein